MEKRIAYVTMFAEQVDIAKSVFRENGYPIRTVLIDIARIAEAIDTLIQDGVRIIIARGGVPAIIRQTHTIPIIELRYSFLDFFDPVKKAYEWSDQVALMGWYSGIRNFHKYRSLLNDSLRYVEFSKTNAQDCEIYIEKEVRRMLEGGVEVVVGGGGVVRAAQRIGCKYVTVGIDREAYIDAAEDAMYELRIHEELERHYETMRSVMNCVSEAVLAVDKSGIITSANTKAKLLLGLPQKSAQTSFEELHLPADIAAKIQAGHRIVNQFVTVNRQNMVVNAESIHLNGQPNGAAVILQETDLIRNMEKKIRRNVVESGHYAKYSFDDIVGISEAIRQAKIRAQKFAMTDTTILISGESGTGKEIFAQSIHNASPRRHEPFVAINCAAIPENILESELFGYVKGAFTGARSEGKAGIFEMAHRGTIFLDEIGEIPIVLQTRLLRVLQEKEVMRIGDDKVIPVDIRVIAATNKNLKTAVKAGEFREDLYYRLCVLSITLPALRNRKEDILPTLHHLIVQGNWGERRFTPEATQLLICQEWHGNIRELGNFAERICVMYPNQELNEKQVAEALGLEEIGPADDSPVCRPPSAGKKDLSVVRSVLEYNKGSRKKTAAQLGISTTTLWRYLKADEK